LEGCFSFSFDGACGAFVWAGLEACVCFSLSGAGLEVAACLLFGGLLLPGGALFGLGCEAGDFCLGGLGLEPSKALVDAETCNTVRHAQNEIRSLSRHRGSRMDSKLSTASSDSVLCSMRYAPAGPRVGRQ